MSTRLTYLAGFILICLLLSISIYLQLFDGFTPCPLCTLQRVCFALLGVWFFIGIFIHKQKIARFFINFLCALTSLSGFFLAGRQIWLQHYPTANSNECGVSLQYMMQVLPFNEMLQKVFTGSAECTERGWEFLYLSMAEWSLVWFAFFLCLTSYLFLKNFNVKK